MTVGWIAERLAMGTRGYLNHLLYRPEEAGRRVNNIKNCPPYTVRLFMNVQATSAPYVQRACNPTAGNHCLPESEPSWLSTQENVFEFYMRKWKGNFFGAESEECLKRFIT